MIGNPWEAHVDEEGLERYAMGTLRDEETAAVEEHLLLCPDCQNKLAELDEFLRALRNPKPDSTSSLDIDSRRKAALHGGAWVRRPVE